MPLTPSGTGSLQQRPIGQVVTQDPPGSAVRHPDSVSGHGEPPRDDRDGDAPSYLAGTAVEVQDHTGSAHSHPGVAAVRDDHGGIGPDQRAPGALATVAASTRVSRGSSALVIQRSPPASAIAAGRFPTFLIVLARRGSAARAGVGLGGARVTRSAWASPRRPAPRGPCRREWDERRSGADGHQQCARGDQRRPSPAPSLPREPRRGASRGFGGQPGSVGAAPGAAAPRATIRSGSVGAAAGGGGQRRAAKVARRRIAIVGRLGHRAREPASNCPRQSRPLVRRQGGGADNAPRAWPRRPGARMAPGRSARSGERRPARRRRCGRRSGRRESAPAPRNRASRPSWPVRVPPGCVSASFASPKSVR